MPRSFFRDSVMVKGPAGAIPLAGAAVSFYQEAPPGSPTTPISFPLYPSREDTSPLALPFVTGSLGEVEVWAERSARVRMIVAKGGLVSADETVDLEWPPEDVPSNGDVSNAIAAHEAKEDPHQQYLLESEADLLYLPIDWLPPDEYLTQDEADLRYAQLGLSYTKGESDARYLQEAQADLRYEQLAQKGIAGGYVPLDGAGKIPNQYLPDLAITETFVAVSEAEMLALDAQTGDVCVRVDTSENYILATEPATVLENWQKLATSMATGNVSVVTREEFLPTAATTTVSLEAVPTELLSITRNGVEQSELAGHFTASGVTITFAEVFTGDEPVNVVYEVGSASGGGGGGGMSQEDADLRYLQLTGGTLTGNLAMSGADLSNRLIRWQTNGVDRWRLGMIDTQPEGGPDVGGDFKLQAVWNDGSLVDIFTIDRDYAEMNFTPNRSMVVTGNRNNTLSIRQPGVTERWDMSPNSIRGYGTGDSQPRIEVTSSGDGIVFRPGTANPATNLTQHTGTGELLLACGGSGGSFRPNYESNLDLGSTGMRWQKLWAGSADFTTPPSYGGTVQPKITVNATAPSSPATGDLWIW